MSYCLFSFLFLQSLPIKPVAPFESGSFSGRRLREKKKPTTEKNDTTLITVNSSTTAAREKRYAHNLKDSAPSGRRFLRATDMYRF